MASVTDRVGECYRSHSLSSECQPVPLQRGATDSGYGLQYRGSQGAKSALLAGHPTLTSRFLELLPTNPHFPSLLLEVAREDGPFGEHLARMWEIFQETPELRSAVQNTISGKPCSEKAFLRLRSAGVLAGPSSDLASVRCTLYAQYLERKLTP